jgi:hypothetical protein
MFAFAMSGLRYSMAVALAFSKNNSHVFQPDVSLSVHWPVVACSDGRICRMVVDRRREWYTVTSIVTPSSLFPNGGTLLSNTINARDQVSLSWKIRSVCLFTYLFVYGLSNYAVSSPKYIHVWFLYYSKITAIILPVLFMYTCF